MRNAQHFGSDLAVFQVQIWINLGIYWWTTGAIEIRRWTTGFHAALYSVYVSGPLARPFHWWGLSCCTAAAYRETYAVLNKSTFYLSSENAKEEKNRRTVARGKLIGAGMAAQAAGVYAVKNSKTCIVMWLEALQSVLYIINISFISYVCVQLHCVVIFAFYL